MVDVRDILVEWILESWRSPFFFELDSCGQNRAILSLSLLCFLFSGLGLEISRLALRFSCELLEGATIP